MRAALACVLAPRKVAYWAGTMADIIEQAFRPAEKLLGLEARQRLRFEDTVVLLRLLRMSANPQTKACLTKTAARTPSRSGTCWL
jgi:hypothetical protein